MEALEILVCQNEHVAALEVERRLERIGHTVTAIATNGEDAFDFAERVQPDIGLLGIKLTGELNGIETAAVLANKFNIPSIFIVDRADLQLVASAHTSEAVGCLVKPFENYQLYMCLQIGLFVHRKQQELIAKLNWSRIQLDASLASVALLQKAAAVG